MKPDTKENAGLISGRAAADGDPGAGLSEDAPGLLCREMVFQEIRQVDLSGLENRVLAQLRKKDRSILPGLFNMLKWPRIWAPAAAAVCMALVIVFTRPPVPETPAPSALVESFEGNIASVMILQTPGTNQTVVWYRETF